MTSAFFIEHEQYRLKDLSERIGNETAKSTEILRRLVLAGIVKLINGTKEESLQGDLNLSRIDENTSFYFDYVGLLDIDGYIFKCYPKFIKRRNPTYSDLRLILLSIERHSVDQAYLKSAREDQIAVPNQLSLALRLVRDYLTYGLYFNQREEQTLYGQGEIDWERTINTTTPLIQDNRPYYFEYYTNDTKQDDSDYFSRLHACVISECSRKLHSSELDEILLLETPTPYYGERIDFGPDDYICQRLQKEYNIQYVTQKQNTLRNLLAWIKSTHLGIESSGIQLFGTNRFHVLWEAMCADVFESQYKQRLNSLDIHLAKGFNGESTLDKLISKPQWQASAGGSPHDADKTLRPDYIRLIKHNDQTFFVILDAKYYDIELNEYSVSRQPGVEDVCKQYLYHMAYNQFIHAHSLVPINAFVSPVDAAKSYVAGHVKIPFFSNLSDVALSPICVIMLSANELMKKYISRKHVSFASEFPTLFSASIANRGTPRPTT